ncbi:Cupin_1 domain-containing protein, partial [Cephalotus follicularis]
GMKLNGFPCKANITSEDFFSDTLANPGMTNTSMGTVVAAVNVQKMPGLNTLGISLSRIDYAPSGLNPPHTHPRASEMIFVLEGELEVGFITTANVLISKTIKKGEVFVFPKGLVHFQRNGKAPATVLAAFNSQFAGTQSIAATLFGASPTVPDDVLSKAFHMDSKEVEITKSKFAPTKQ